MTYDGRVAIVTGAGSGMGRALAVALTRGGARVAGWDVDETGLAATRDLCPPELLSPYRVDVSDRKAVADSAATVERDLGSASMVFNNAGVDVYAGIADMTWADYDWLIGVNLSGVVNVTKAALPQLLRTGTADRPAVLVTMSSAFGLAAVPYQGAYSLSKFAVRGLTEALRQEMLIERRPVNVHCVHPGVVRTNFGVNMRKAQPDEDPELAGQLFDRLAMTSAERATEVILRGVERNRPRILVGPDGRALAAMPRLFGAGYMGLLARTARLANRWTTARRPH